MKRLYKVTIEASPEFYIIEATSINQALKIANRKLVIIQRIVTKVCKGKEKG